MGVMHAWPLQIVLEPQQYQISAVLSQGTALINGETSSLQVSTQVLQCKSIP